MFDIPTQTQKSPFFVISTENFLFLDRSASFDAGSFGVISEWQGLHDLVNNHIKVMCITFLILMLIYPSLAHSLRFTMNS